MHHLKIPTTKMNLILLNTTEVNMKARVKATGEIVDVIQVGTKTHLFDLNNVEFIDAPEDYWTRLEHQYAGMEMQGDADKREDDVRLT